MIISTHELVDNRHRRFTADLHEEDKQFELCLTHSGKYVGDVLFTINEAGEMDLQSILIMDRIFRFERLRCFFTRKRPGFTRNGLGYKALALALELGKLHGALYVTGYISGPNFRTDPTLIDWYVRQGFTVQRTPKDVLGSVAILYKSLE
jgi:hypothetical protein